MDVAKRFTDTEKWDDPWFTELPDRLKLFWLYICDKADLAGVWKVHKGLAETYLGGKVDLDAALIAFTPKRIEVFNDGERWRIKRFIEFQYGNLHENSPMFKAVSKCQALYPIDTLSIPYEYPTDTPLVRVKDMDEVRVKELMASFEVFWNAYPKKKAKKEALTAWKKISPDETLLKNMLDSIEIFKKSEDWIKQDGTFIPYPATWLNGARWKDEISLGVSSGRNSPSQNAKGASSQVGRGTWDEPNL